jgi:hypothetical protein
MGAGWALTDAFVPADFAVMPLRRHPPDEAWD